MLHDLGKFTPAFQKRLSGSKEAVDHSTAGAAMALRLTQSGKADDRIAGQLIAYVVAGHHAGLPDKEGESLSTLSHRIGEFDLAALDPVWTTEIVPEVTGLMPRLKTTPIRKEDPEPAKQMARARAAFQLAFLGRMIFSCLVDADFKNTEAFYTRLEGREIDRQWPALQDLLDELIGRFDRHMSGVAKLDSDLNRLRAEILGHVRGRASEKPGLFTMTVPTGGGKTLASLGFALDHAKAHGLRRIIYAIPFTSIVDQTARIFKNVLGDKNVLEHHSAIEEERDRGASRADSEWSDRDKLRLAMEDWAAPVIVTTNVQLFESLFASRTSRARKLHNIAGSVIVLDEAQTLPRPLLTPALWALRELSENYGCTIVLCTATQPALDQRNFKDGHPAKALDLAGRELAPDPARLAKALTRVTIRHAGPLTDDALVAELADTRQALVIVNSRGHALSLYRRAREAGLDGMIHLTTRQVAQHRRAILKDVRARLKDGRACRVIATSLVEAGVDLDFPRVWRAEAGLDQVLQAAGRCNREGGRPVADSVVTVFEAPDNPPLPEIKALSGDKARMMLRNEDLLSPQAVADYFGEVYWRTGKEGLDRKEILDDFKLSGMQTSFAYRTVAEKFRMIESGMVPVIVRRDAESRQAVEDLSKPFISSGGIARRLQNYLVQVPPRARQRLRDCGHVAFLEPNLREEQFAVLLSDSLYDEDVGLLWEDAEYLAAESMIL